MKPMSAAEATRCVIACYLYLMRQGDSPRAAGDLIHAVRVLSQGEKIANMTKPKLPRVPIPKPTRPHHTRAKELARKAKHKVARPMQEE